MNTGDILLKDIHDNREDDTPRLIYADWLMDNGEPERGEFIKLQVELHHEEEGHYSLDASMDWQKVYLSSTNAKIRRSAELLSKLFVNSPFDYGLLANESIWKRGFIHTWKPTYSGFSKENVIQHYMSNHPIEKIIISDKRPWYIRENSVEWELAAPPFDHNAHYRLPKHLWDMLDMWDTLDEIRDRRATKVYIVFCRDKLDEKGRIEMEANDAAIHDLSEAALTHARTIWLGLTDPKQVAEPRQVIS